MLTFLLVFFSIYSAAHLYLAVRLARAFRLDGSRILLTIFMLLMIATPALVRVAEQAGHEKAALLLAWAGYTWMGFLFFFVCVALVLDFFRLLIFIVALFKPKMEFTPLSPKTGFLLPAILAVAVCIYGYREARDIRVRELSLQTAKLPAGTERFRIVQLSDLHLGLMVNRELLADVVWKVQELAPDLLVSTGDLVDGQRDGLSGLAGLLAGIKTRSGKLAVTGNHEFYAGIEHSLAFTSEAGFTVLRGETLTVNEMLVVAGIDDRTGTALNGGGDVDEKNLLAGIPAERFTLLLKHRPEPPMKTERPFDLQLSGHTHGGQVFPFGFLTALLYPCQEGVLHKLASTAIYVSPGTGTWGPPFRFLSPPEITVIDLKPLTKPAE